MSTTNTTGTGTSQGASPSPTVSPTSTGSLTSTTATVTGPITSVPGVTTPVPITTTTPSQAVTTPVSTTASTSNTIGDTTSTVSATTPPPSTQLITSTITQSSSPGQTSVPPVTVTLTSQVTPTTSRTSSTSATPSSTAALQNGGSTSSSSGLSAGGRTAIAVVVPVVSVALIVLALLFFWRRRKQRKSAAEARRKEVEEYGYNPNSDPTIPAIASDGRSEMTQDQSGGYRGWGAASSARKASTTMSGGHTRGQLSDAGSNNGGLSTSPTAVGGSDGQNSDNYTHPHNDGLSSDNVAALGAAPAAGANRDGIRRGPSNASSSYSAGHRSEPSDQSIPPPLPDGPVSPQNYGYGQHGPYGDGSYGGGDGMPVVRDVSARRNTKIEQGGGYQQGNSGISQNF